MGTLPDEPAKEPLPRLTSLDAYRGFIMLVLASGQFGIPKVAEKFPQDPFWQDLAFQFNHVKWAGCAFWDLIQPSFMFMVGVALPFSFASRQARGDSNLKIFLHAVSRSIILILLGIFLSSLAAKKLDFTFVNVLTQIGLGYTFVFLLVNRRPVIQLGMAVLILALTWFLFFQHPLVTPGYDLWGTRVNEPEERFGGWFAHWDKNANFAASADREFLNWFPRSERFVMNKGGYQTLNFVPSMATMIFGLMAGEMLRGRRGKGAKLAWLMVAGAACLGLGWLMDQHVCPSVKRIWTPSWTVFSSGWTFLMLAAFYLLIDVASVQWWAFPLVVVGMNSIAMYFMGQMMKGWTGNTLEIFLGPNVFSGTYGPIWQSLAVLLVLWLICLWLYRRKIFIRI